MIYLQFFIGFLMYGAMAYASYDTDFKSSNWFYPVAIFTAIIANVIWFSVAKSDHNPNSLVIKGLIWDVMLMFCYLLVPIILFNAKFTMYQTVGIILILSGLLLTKVG